MFKNKHFENRIENKNTRKFKKKERFENHKIKKFYKPNFKKIKLKFLKTQKLIFKN